jgi:hypothetical protein
MYYNDLRRVVLRMLDIGRVVIVTGGPGTGKSTLFSGISDELEIGFIDVRLSQLDPVDMRGCPSIDTKRKLSEFYPPSFWPREGNGILFLDEFTSANPSLQTAAMQLVLDRKLGEYEVPEGWAIALAGNRETDQSLVYRMLGPMANRLIHLELQADLGEWKQWAYKAEIDPSIIAYLSFKESDFCHDPQSGIKCFPTPRTWEYASDIMKDPEMINEIPAVLRETLEGTVGVGPASGYLAYRELTSAINVDDVIHGKEYVLPEDLTVLHSVNATIAARFLKGGKKFAEKYTANVIDYITRIPVTEMQVVAIRELINIAGVPIIGNRDPEVQVKWRELSSNIRDYIDI